MVDGYGHVVTMAQDCDARNCGGERELSTPGEDSNIDEAVDNVVRAIYKRAKRDGDLGKKEEETGSVNKCVDRENTNDINKS